MHEKQKAVNDRTDINKSLTIIEQLTRTAVGTFVERILPAFDLRQIFLNVIFNPKIFNLTLN
jgi:hypothetical protein